ncbi:MAG: hypothetical protein JXQ75_07970 [Phycisphaerae bacterium]|nr:hypothetical protein [Phycisphaerae bacterium]
MSTQDRSEDDGRAFGDCHRKRRAQDLVVRVPPHYLTSAALVTDDCIRPPSQVG